jgi:hypothetical protein
MKFLRILGPRIRDRVSHGQLHIPDVVESVAEPVLALFLQCCELLRPKSDQKDHFRTFIREYFFDYRPQFYPLIVAINKYPSTLSSFTLVERAFTQVKEELFTKKLFCDAIIEFKDPQNQIVKLEEIFSLFSSKKFILSELDIGCSTKDFLQLVYNQNWDFLNISEQIEKIGTYHDRIASRLSEFCSTLWFSLEEWRELLLTRKARTRHRKTFASLMNCLPCLVLAFRILLFIQELLLLWPDLQKDTVETVSMEFDQACQRFLSLAKEHSFPMLIGELIKFFDFVVNSLKLKNTKEELI